MTSPRPRRRCSWASGSSAPGATIIRSKSYGQDDYYGLAAYFARVKTKRSDDFGLFGNEQVVYVARTGEVYQPRTGKKMVPRPLGGAPADDPRDRRRGLRAG